MKISIKFVIISHEQIKQIQDACLDAMDLWGYRRIEDFSNFSSIQQTFDPMVMPPPFTWTRS